jgi:hypothetical protein
VPADERNFEERIADRLHTQGEPTTQPPAAKETEKATDGWFRELKDGRLETMLKTPEVRLRVSGSPERVWQAVELFEEWTGRQVAGDWVRPPKRGARPIPGQESLLMDERPSDDEDNAD